MLHMMLFGNCHLFAEHCLSFSHVVLRGDKSEEAVLCTENATYELRAADTSNILLLLPSLKTPRCKGTTSVNCLPFSTDILQSY